MAFDNFLWTFILICEIDCILLKNTLKLSEFNYSKTKINYLTDENNTYFCNDVVGHNRLRQKETIVV